MSSNIQMAQQFTTAPTSPNLYITQTINNLNLITIINNEPKDQTKKYYKIIQEIETMVDIQLQLHIEVPLTVAV